MRIIFALLAALLFGGTANAADFPSTKDSPVLSEATSNPFAGLFVGVNVGGQFTSIAFSHPDFDELFDGLANDGFVGGGHAGFRMCPGRVCVGLRFEGGWSNGETTFADIEILTFDAYRQLTAELATLVGKSTLIDLHAGYEWQDWTVGNSTDAEVGMWVVGVGLQTLVAENTAFGVRVDYLMLDDAEVGGFDASDLLEDTEALRVQATLTYYPSVKLPSLESVRW